MGLESKVRHLATAAKAALLTLAVVPALAAQSPMNERYRVPRSRTEPRIDTQCIVLHTSEGEFGSSMPKIQREKTANYVLDRTGTWWPVVHERDVAAHAGISMYNGVRNLKRHCLGIEMIGYAESDITAAQYKALREDLPIIQKRLKVPDSKVLGHYQVACCRMNRFVRAENKQLGLPREKPHRGGRFDPYKLDWERAGIEHNDFDPDVAAGRLHLNRAHARKIGITASQVARGEKPRTPATDYQSNTIHNGNTAWTIAGDRFDEPSTLYVFPDKRIVPGDKIKDWDRMPAGTRVYLNTSIVDLVGKQQPVLTIDQGESAWSEARGAADDRDTYYILPKSNKIVRGDKMDIENVHAGTRVVLNAKGPYTLNGTGPMRYAGRSYNTENSIYVYPDGRVETGNAVKNFRSLPKGTQLLVR